MPDPISPTGSPGQLPNMAQAQTSNTVTSGASVVEAGKGSVPGTSKTVDASEQEQQAVSLLIAHKKQPDKNAKNTAEVPSIEEATKTLKEYLKNLPSDLQFKKDKETGTVMFKVINPVTKEVIREFPPEEVVEMTKKLRKMNAQNQKSGFLFDADS